MAIRVKKTPAWAAGQGMKLTGTGPGMAVPSTGGGGGGGGGGSRPLIDAYHTNVWNCDETAGATVLVDSVGGKNITLQGTAGTDYSLGQYVSGDAVPFLRCLNDGQNYVAASTSSMNFSASAATLECVVRMTALPEFPSSERMVMVLDNGTQYLYISFTDQRPTASVYGRKAYGGQYTAGGGSGSTNVWNYLNGFDAQSNATYANDGSTTTTVDSTYHLMYVFDSSESTANRHKFYINGTLVATTQSNGLSDAMTGLTNFALGGQSGQTRSSQCYVRDVRISNIARDATYAAAAFSALV